MISLGSLTHAPPTKNPLSAFRKNPISSSVIGGYHKAEYTANFPLTVTKFGKVLASSNSDNVASQHEVAKEQLPEGLVPELMPNHVAIIMDGNRRWAMQRDLPAMQGHAAGRRTLHQLYRLCSKWGIKVLTVFAFSTENWSRPKVCDII